MPSMLMISIKEISRNEYELEFNFYLDFFFRRVPTMRNRKYRSRQFYCFFYIKTQFKYDLTLARTSFFAERERT